MENLTEGDDGSICLVNANTSIPNLQLLQNQSYINENNTIEGTELAMPMKFEYKIELTLLRIDKYYYIIYIIALNFVFNGLLPFSLIIIMNILLYKELKTKSNTGPKVTHLSVTHSVVSAATGVGANQTLLKNRKKKKEMKRNDIMMSKVTLAVAFMFLVCHSIRWIPNIFELAQRTMYENQDLGWPFWAQSVTCISHFLIVLNASANFYIYQATHCSTND